MVTLRGIYPVLVNIITLLSSTQKSIATVQDAHCVSPPLRSSFRKQCWQKVLKIFKEKLQGIQPDKRGGEESTPHPRVFLRKPALLRPEIPFRRKEKSEVLKREQEVWTEFSLYWSL